ncbi:hypothetical protein M6B38_306385 [Iris pallida]|uniref:Uncharacterized protein n=1 Tax=Iris pallida TaxID=29817 RepID=A0AAX6HK81_IRIPA|nr:hypothetical protein M6B38_228535 [Iris pallida]KAJ6801376.1 hypothetical protein M6B38_197705 [Iris pallida]KAJ6841490.1 hypothetical protein M6B38_306385 [Iris pallida]
MCLKSLEHIQPPKNRFQFLNQVKLGRVLPYIPEGGQTPPRAFERREHHKRILGQSREGRSEECHRCFRSAIAAFFSPKSVFYYSLSL